MIPSLQSRDRQPELMDEPGLDANKHRKALRDLARINRFSRSSHIFWPSICRLAEQHPGRKLRILDIACGGGDVVLSLSNRAARTSYDFRFEGCDLSPVAVEHAQQRARHIPADVRFFQCDVLNSEIPPDYDVLTCSLFLHHLDEPTALSFLSKMSQAARSLVLINDLVRCRPGYLLAHAACRVLSQSPIVHVDGPRSVAAAFTPSEALELARQAGWSDPQISRHWPLRYLLSGKGQA